MKPWKMKWEDMDCKQILQVVNVVFYGGFLVLMLALLLLYFSEEISVLLTVLAVLGGASCFGGVLLAYTRLRCPFCGASLMLGGRIPTHIPNFCPECGKPL